MGCGCMTIISLKGENIIKCKDCNKYAAKYNCVT